jgi:hypothetical protein
LVGGDHECALYPSRAGAEGLDSAENEPAVDFVKSGWWPLSGGWVCAPHAEQKPAFSYLRELGGAQRLGAGEREALDAVEVPVEDARGRSVGGGHGAHEPDFACEPVRSSCEGADGGEIGEVLGGETRLAVELARASDDPLERPLQALDGCGADWRRRHLGAHAATPFAGAQR